MHPCFRRNCTLTRHEKGPPPPPMIFTAQLEVCQHDCNLSARHKKHACCQSQEAEEVVILLQPHGRHDEEELDENGPANSERHSRLGWLS